MNLKLRYVSHCVQYEMGIEKMTSPCQVKQQCYSDATTMNDGFFWRS